MVMMMMIMMMMMVMMGVMLLFPFDGVVVVVVVVDDDDGDDHHDDDDNDYDDDDDADDDDDDDESKLMTTWWHCSNVGEADEVNDVCVDDGDSLMMLMTLMMMMRRRMRRMRMRMMMMLMMHDDGDDGDDDDDDGDDGDDVDDGYYSNVVADDDVDDGDVDDGDDVDDVVADNHDDAAQQQPWPRTPKPPCSARIAVLRLQAALGKVGSAVDPWKGKPGLIGVTQQLIREYWKQNLDRKHPPWICLVTWSSLKKVAIRFDTASPVLLFSKSEKNELIVAKISQSGTSAFTAALMSWTQLWNLGLFFCNRTQPSF